MPEETPEIEPDHSTPEATGATAFRITPLFVASLLFLAASVGILLLVIRQNRSIPNLPPPPTPVPISATATTIPTNTAAPTTSPEITATALPTPTVTATGDLLIGVVAEDDDELAQSLVDALNEALAASPHLIELGVQVIAASDMTALSADAKLILLAQSSSDGLIAISLTDRFSPPLLQLESPYSPWIVAAPGENALHLPPDRLNFAAETALAVLELGTSLVSDAETRIQALQGVVPSSNDGVNEATSLFLLGQAEVRQGAYMSALATHSTALRVRADFPAIVLNRGNVYLALGDTATALTAYESIDVPELKGTADYNRAVAHLERGETIEAHEAAEAISANGVWRDNLLGVIAHQQEDLATAISFFETAVDNTDEPKAVLFNLALSLRKSGNAEQAYIIYEELLADDSTNSEYLLYLALTYWSESRLPSTERFMNRAIEYDTTYALAYYHRARFYAEQAEYEKLLEDAQNALRVNPYLVDLHVMVGDAHRALGDTAEAIAAYDRAIESGIETAHVYASRGLAYHDQGFARTALRDYEVAVSLDSTEPEVLYRMGIVLFDAGLWEDALEASLGAVEGGLDTADALARLALALDANVRRVAEAEEAYLRAIELDAGYTDWTYIAELPLWSGTAVTRARTIISRLDLEER